VPTGPPKVLVPAKPRSSTSTTITLGTPSGAVTSKRGGGSALRTSSSVYTGRPGSGIGRTVLSSVSAACSAVATTINSPSATIVVSESPFFISISSFTAR
jgi:hypothetical protein